MQKTNKKKPSKSFGVSARTSKRRQAAPAAADTDPRYCGLKDAVRRGWYCLDTGELFPGFKIGPDDIVLDVGCGEGNAVEFCARQKAHVVFTDVEAEKVETAARRALIAGAKKIEGFVSDSLPLPLPDAYVTRILATEMLEHTSAPERILAELVRVGQSGARYMITVPDDRSELLQKPVAHPVYFSEPNHIQIFDKDRLIRLVEAAGLTVEKYDTWGFYWTVFMSLFWISSRNNNVSGAVLDRIEPPYHPVLQSWSNTWSQLMELDGSEKLMQSFDRFLPKTQIILASKA